MTVERNRVVPCFWEMKVTQAETRKICDLTRLSLVQMCIFLYLQSRLNVPHWKTADVKEFDGWLFISSWLFPITRFSHTCRHPFRVTSPAANQRACCITNCESTWNLPVWFLSVHASSSGVPKSVSVMFCRLSLAFSFKSCADHPIKHRSSVRAAAGRYQSAEML